MKMLLNDVFRARDEEHLDLCTVSTQQKVLMASFVALFMIAAMYLLATV